MKTKFYIPFPDANKDHVGCELGYGNIIIGKIKDFEENKLILTITDKKIKETILSENRFMSIEYEKVA